MAKTVTNAGQQWSRSTTTFSLGRWLRFRRETESYGKTGVGFAAAWKAAWG